MSVQEDAKLLKSYHFVPDQFGVYTKQVVLNNGLSVTVMVKLDHEGLHRCDLLLSEEPEEEAPPSSFAITIPKSCPIQRLLTKAAKAVESELLQVARSFKSGLTS